MILFPNKIQRKYLRQMGCSVFPQFLNVRELDGAHAHAQSQHPEESDQEAMARAIARLAWHQKGHRRLFVYVIVILVLILCVKANAQRGVDGVVIQDSSGASVHGYFGGIAKLKCSTNINCTYSGGVVSMVVNSAGIAGRPYLDMVVDCGLVGDGVTDDSAAAQACFDAHQGYAFYFPKTQANNTCSYFFGTMLVPKGDAVNVGGAAAGFRNSATTSGGAVLCFAAGVTGISLDLTYTTGASVHDLVLYGNNGTGFMTDSTLVNITAGGNLPQYSRAIASIQRTANVLTVNTTAVAGQEGITQLVGSQVLISGVVGDATMNGRCVIATLTNLNAFSENPTGFTCAQNGSDAGPFATDGTLKLATSGTSTADGIRVCGNFFKINNVMVKGFGRHGINADAVAGHGCAFPFADDLNVRDSTFINNQGDGVYCQGTDCNVNLYEGNSLYYNLLWGAEDNSGLGNTWVMNNISNNGAAWVGSGGSTPATKAISTISRTLVSGVSTVTVVLSVANTSVKQGSCIVVAGVTDTTFNTPANQCYFVTAYTNSTHFQWEQPGAPADASSSSGTVRMSKFIEVYLSAGVDSGGPKFATQSPSSQTVAIYNYVEGGQLCKMNAYAISIGGPVGGCNVTQSTWQPSFLNVQGSGGGGFGGTLESNLGLIAWNKDQNQNIYFRSGVASTARSTNFNFTKYDNSVAWVQSVDTSGTAGDTATWIIQRNGGPRRFTLFGPSSASGITRISSESTGAVEFNNDANTGTGGIKVCDGAAVPACLQIKNSTASTVGAAGGASALPGTPSGYLVVVISGTTFKIPYYAN